MQNGKLLKLDHIETGKTFACGDIHGCYEDLISLLEENLFDFDNDRLICCGDLIDRGPDSLMCVNLIDEPWFYTVMGNHEDMALQCLASRNTGEIDPWWVANGGHWFYGLDFEPAKELLINKLCDLPIGIEVTVNKNTIAIIHADPLYLSWSKTKDKLKEINKHYWSNCEYSNSDNDNIIANALWSRDRVKEDMIIEGCDLMIHGHTIMKDPVNIGNRLLLDTGSFLKYFDGREGNISIVCLDDI